MVPDKKNILSGGRHLIYLADAWPIFVSALAHLLEIINQDCFTVMNFKNRLHQNH